MQAQAQLAGQVTGCIPLAPIAQQPWQHEANDVPLRRRVLERISQVFLRSKHQFSLEWQQRIPDLVKLVEGTLYKEASSRDEYQDAQTLDRRLQIVANRFLGQQRAASMIDDLSRSSATLMGNGSNMVPTPGMGGSMMPTPGFSSGMMPTPGTNNVVPMRTGSTMMPTPGLASNKLGLRGNTSVTSSNMGNFVATSNQTFSTMPPPQTYQGLNGARILQNGPLVSTGFSTGGMQMVPTPGVSMQQHPAMSSGPVNQVHAQQFTPGNMVGNNITLKGNGITNGMVMTRQQLLNGNVDSAAYASMLQQQQQRFNPQRMQPSMGSGANGGSYAMNAADLAGSGSMYVSNGMSINPQVPKLSTQSEVPSQPQVVQQQSYQQQSQPQPQQQQLQQSQSSLQQPQQQGLQTTSSQMQQVQMQRGTFQQNGQHTMMVRQDSGTFQHSDLLREAKQSGECQSSSTKMEQQSVRQISPKPQDQQVRHQMQLPKAEVQALVSESQEIQPKNASPAQNLQHHSPMQEATDAQPPAEQSGVKQEQESPISSVSTQGGVQGQAGNPVSNTRAQQYLKQQRWLLFLRHASKCKEGQCPSNQHCRTARELLDHISKCRIRDRECPYLRCSASMKLLMHHQVCRDARCPVCGPVRQAILKTVAPGTARENGPPAKRPKLETAPEHSEQAEGFAYSNGALKAEAQDIKPQGVYANGQYTKAQIKVDAQVQLKQNIKAEHGSTELAETKSGALVPGPPGVPTQVATGKGGKPKLLGVSLTELFTPEQIRHHIASLRQWVGQSKSKAEKNQAMEHQPNDNACPLCAVEKLSFEPPPIYCTTCGIRVKRNAMYYTTAVRETRHYFCVPCYNDVKTEMVELEGLTYAKANLERRKHDEETEEAWVCCDKCNLWQHQICALFNARRNEGAETEYTCPQCCMAEMESGERVPTPGTAVLGAKDLPRTYLSDHLEQRLAVKLRQERAERSRVQGKSFEEVPGADGLVVRVVSSVDKKLEVKPRFLEIFQEEDYPTEFPYKSKAVLLFQQIEGVEVCLYGMYVQEFGVESAQPNQRRIYLSYLDSVKYFRPDVRTLNGEALRTFVYHELLIAYLEYCKMRGFSSCYIWACPPLKGEDYILYCHPEIQKTPKSDKLREWYLTMLRKATKENIVVEVTNFYDYFFVSNGECKAKVTAARLPYFDGDYWPGAAEDMILQLQQQADDDDSKQQKKGKVKKPPTKRATKAAAQMEMALNASKDLQLMQKLGESIMPMKEDFIMVHMHHSCTHCRLFITSGNRWVCKSCKTFQLCDRCNDAEMKLDDRERHPPNSKEVHQLIPIEVNDVPPDTKDQDEIMESEFFDTRHAFLSLCQGNHYQYDTLRRAKHSSMMVLYHLHNPMAPAFVITCCICNNDIETGQGWRCETCTEYDVCEGCYQKEETKRHPHRLVPHPSTDRSQNKEGRQQRVQQLRTMLDLLLHASHCTTAACKYPNCCSLKRLFRHGMTCQKRIAGGCMFCKKMWYFMQLHARACKQTQCRVPRCKDLKEHLRRLQHQMESRRRAAVNEMMRQRAAETAGRT